jgi:hypothetical protein
VSEYRPCDFKQNKGRPVSALVDTRILTSLSEITATRGTSMAVELRRATREYVERELPKAKAEIERESA